jgi:hypothetical protein
LIAKVEFYLPGGLIVIVSVDVNISDAIPSGMRLTSGGAIVGRRDPFHNHPLTP